MLNVRCRLCSSEKTLISLFNGKSRGNRDHIRKLAHVTTGIKFQKNDACKYICFPCTVQIYNFYIFRARSIENEEKLQRSTVTNVKVKSNKIDIPDVEDITLPNLEELQETLSPWLVSKQKCCATENCEDINESDSKTACIENSTQCDPVQNFDKETQIQPSHNETFTQTNTITTRYVQIQCDLTKRNKKTLKNACNECATQTEAANKNQSVLIQCDLIKKNQRMSKKAYKEDATQTEADSANQSVYVQCELLKENQKTPKKSCKEGTTQTEAADTKQSVSIQCELVKRIQKIPKQVCKKGTTRTGTINTNQSVLIQCELIKANQNTPKSDGRENVTQSELNNINDLDRDNDSINSHKKILKKSYDYISRSVQCQTIRANRRIVINRGGKDRPVQMDSNCANCSGLLVAIGENELLKSNQKIEKENKDSSTQTESKCDNSESHNCTRCRQMDIKDGVKLGLVGVKREIESPRSLSPMKSLSISVDGTKNEIQASPTGSYASPRSSGLLTIQDRIQHVIICEHCDKTLYSKNEYRLHRRSHQICNFCKKRFSTIKKTKKHIESDCEVKKSIKPQPVVPLIRLEDSRDIRKKYPGNLKRLNKLGETKYNRRKDVKKIFRLRSRSISSVDNIYNNFTSCKCCISILKQISVGVDKSVQTNFLLDKELIKTPLEYFCENLLLKRNLKGSVNDDDFVPTKKLKLS